MANYQDMITRIADELSRSDLTTQIQNEIQSAIAYYQNERFYFNERRDVTWNTVIGQEFYTSTDIPDLSLLTQMDAMTITVNQDRFKVRPWPYPNLEQMSVTTTTQGQPGYYSIYAQQIRLYPIPQMVYPMRLSGLFVVAAPVNMSDSNVWTNDAEELIRARAKKNVCINIIKDAANAATAQAQETEAYRNIVIRTSQFTASGQFMGSL